ncbi:hypothetical protein GCM10020229_59990 [Kitasatospora albolonga]
MDAQDLAGPHTARPQVVRQAVGELVQLPVADGVFAEDQGGGGGAGGGLFGEDSVHGVLGVDGGRAAAPPPGENAALLGGEQVQLPDREFGAGQGGLDQPQQPLAEGLDGGAVQQVGGVLEQHADALGVLGQLHDQVELGHVQVDDLGLGGQAGEVGPGVRAVLQHQHDLEERVAGERAGRVELLHQALEGQVLVGVGVQVGVPDPGDQLAEAGVAGEVGAQHQGVDEEPDQVLQRTVGPAGHRGAQRDVGGTGEPGEQGGQGGLHHHEQGGVVAPGELLDPVAQRAVDPGGQHLAVEGRGGRAGPVGREGQLLREVGQGPPPVGELGGQQALRVLGPAQQLLLPEGVVGVLHRQWLPLRGGAVAAGPVGGGQVPQQRGQRPAVGGDVVQGQQEGVPFAVLLGGCLEQVGAEREFGGEVEAVRGGGADGPDQLALGGAGDGPGDLGPLQHLLVRDAVPLGEDRAQGLVPLGQVGDRGPQGRPVERAGEADGQGDVVGGAGALDLVEEPEAGLCEGQRSHRASRCQGIRPLVGPPQWMVVRRPGRPGWRGADRSSAPRCSRGPRPGWPRT